MANITKCDQCPIRRYAERKPRSILARIWNWHKRWCPGWKARQRAIEQQGNPPENSQNR